MWGGGEGWGGEEGGGGRREEKGQGVWGGGGGQMPVGDRNMRERAERHRQGPINDKMTRVSQLSARKKGS